MSEIKSDQLEKGRTYIVQYMKEVLFIGNFMGRYRLNVNVCNFFIEPTIDQNQYYDTMRIVTDDNDIRYYEYTD